MIYGARPIKRKRRTNAEMDGLREAILSTLHGYHPQTLRQVFYQLTTMGVITKEESQYKALGRVLVQMREDGAVPWGWVADNTRWQRKPRTFASLEDALNETARYYRRSLWNEADEYVEVWVEKDALAGVLVDVTARWDVPLMVSRGFASVSYIYECAQAIEAQEKPATIYYFGDHDPSGVHIDRSIEKRLRQFAPDADITFERVAVQKWQIEEWNLPTRPTKKTDSRSHSFEGDSVELDAIPPQRLTMMLDQCIQRHVDEELWIRTQDIEEAERETIQMIASKYAEEGTA
jgi:hypothetical protein